jgi:hypothetical protein
MKSTGSTGQSITDISDEALLELLLRQDLPGYLTNIYNTEAHRRMAQSIVQGQQELPI